MNKKKLINNIFKFFNLKIGIYKKNFDEILEILINKKKPIIFDIGANKGQSISRFLKLFIQPTIHAFEPLPKLGLHLKNNFKIKNVIINNFALGEKNEKKFIYLNNIGNYGAMASFYKLRLNSKFINNYIKYKKNKFGQSLSTKKIESKIITLDSYIKNKNINSIDLLKIDTQGYEKEILLGSINALKSKIIKNIELEFIINDSYEIDFHFHDFDKILSDCGYKIYAISDYGDLYDLPQLNIDLIYTINVK